MLPRDRRPLILVVDDDAANLELLTRMLTRADYRVETASDGEEGLAALAAHPPDVVVLDVQMPRLNGFEVCRRIKHHPATRLIPVVLVTGLHERPHRLEGIDAGADDFLSKPFDRAELRARIGSLIRLKRYTDELDSAESVILSLALTIEARDVNTKGHCERLARYATSLGTALGLSDDDLAALHRGGYLHDVGKIGIPDALLLKTTALTSAEYEVMKTHTTIGERLCGSLRALQPVREIIRHHHERLDGSGYPDHLRGDAVPLLAQIIGVVDVFDAVTSDRPYRPALTPEAACAELLAEVEKGWKSEELVKSFIALVRYDSLFERVRRQTEPPDADASTAMATAVPPSDPRRL
jgi:cyclic di-GMP phosphodiesterase